MQLDWVELRDFRSYRSCRVEPETGVNVLIGPNGAGKTNFLEALSYLATMRSFRHAPDEAVIRTGATVAIARAHISSGGRQSQIELEVPEAGRRRLLINGKSSRGAIALVDHYRRVVFLPDDLDLIKRGPAGRRDLLDEIAVQLWPVALAEQREFQRALRQRNSLLRERSGTTSLEAWDQRLSQAGAKVTTRRDGALAAIGPWLSETYKRLAGVAEDVKLEYRSKWRGDGAAEQELEEALLETLTESRAQDLERALTTRGPHRDDPAFVCDGREARTHASQGEQRTIAIAVRLATHHAVQEHVSETPVLLLDDVFSELDLGRARALGELLPKAQTFVTTARDEEVPVSGRRWEVKEGELR